MTVIQGFFKYWRLNISILTDEEILNELSKNIEECFMINDNNEVTASILWEGCNAVI